MEREKVLFVQKINEGEFETESVWCIKDGNNYILDNIPFIAKRVSLGDIVAAEYDDEDKAYYFSSFVDVSGNSTIRIYFTDLNILEDVRAKMDELGCSSEGFLARKILAVNVPRLVNYSPVKQYLEKGESSGAWSYEESCLAHEY